MTHCFLLYRSCSGEFEVNREKTQGEFVFEVSVASNLPLPLSGNHRPSECVTWTQEV